MSIVNLRVKNFRDDKFGVSINNDRRWRGSTYSIIVLGVDGSNIETWKTG
jgi:hypothetical protein